MRQIPLLKLNRLQRHYGPDFILHGQQSYGDLFTAKVPFLPRIHFALYPSHAYELLVKQAQKLENPSLIRRTILHDPLPHPRPITAFFIALPMSDSPERPPSNQSGSFNFGVLISQQDIMERQPDAVTRPRPWDILWQHRDQSPQPLPPGTRIIDRFNHSAGGALLILGEPGSGKTTILLESAEQLLANATTNEGLRVPVVFNLSSWAVKQPPLTDWLVAKLQTLYLIPHKVAQALVGQDDILPLLDGLDEVTSVQVISLPVSRKGVA